MNCRNEDNKLNRFTKLPFLIQLLKTRNLVFLSPKTWEDHNDTDILMDYKEKEKIAGLLALCFTDKSETIHHWKTFASGESGCCIEFKKKELLDILSQDKRIKHCKVKYHSVLKSSKIDTNDIPFTKRYPYKCEEEYRVILKHEEDLLSCPIKIELNTIKKITLSPNLPTLTFDTIKEVLQTLIGTNDIEINPSSIFENKDWIEGFKKRSSV